LTPKSEPDLTVDLSNCVIDVSSRCDLSLAARDTVEPAKFFNLSDRMSDTTGCDQLPESLKFAYTELEPRPRVFTLRCLFFFTRGSKTPSLTEYQESLLPVEHGVLT